MPKQLKIPNKTNKVKTEQSYVQVYMHHSISTAADHSPVSSILQEASVYAPVGMEVFFPVLRSQVINTQAGRCKRALGDMCISPLTSKRTITSRAVTKPHSMQYRYSKMLQSWLRTGRTPYHNQTNKQIIDS